jgi:transcriptional regulator with XRE-family HTH domain
MIYAFRILDKPRYCLAMPVFPALPKLHARLVAALTEARRDAKLRQVDLAKRLGWQQAYVSRYETGERMLAVDEYVAVARAIGVDPVALLAQVLDIDGGSTD